MKKSEFFFCRVLATVLVFAVTAIYLPPYFVFYEVSKPVAVGGGVLVAIILAFLINGKALLKIILSGKYSKRG